MTLEEKASQLVNQSRAIPRLHIPEYDWRSEALHGIAGPRPATVFPEPIGIAATFDPAAYLERAVELDPQNDCVHYFLGKAYQGLGRTADVNQHFAIARQLRNSKRADERTALQSAP